MEFNKRIRDLRKAKGVKQEDVAKYLDITPKAYGFYELGQREPSLSSLIALCKYFDVSADYILGLTDF